MSTQEPNATMAVFLDLENIARGAEEADFPPFDIRKIIQRLLVKGHIVVKKAYCDFARYKDFKRELHEQAFELIEIPHRNQSGKNSADIRMVVDALDICYRNPHVNTFVIVSGDSDFSPAVSKLRENGKTVIGVGVKKNTAKLFIGNCDEFLYYDDFLREEQVRQRKTATPPAPPKAPGSASKEKAEPAAAPDKATATKKGKAPTLPVEKALDELVSTLEALRGGGSAEEGFMAGSVKDTIKRQSPGFDERAHGFSTFSKLLVEAETRGLVKLNKEGAGGFRVWLAESP